MMRDVFLMARWVRARWTVPAFVVAGVACGGPALETPFVLGPPDFPDFEADADPRGSRLSDDALAIFGYVVADSTRERIMAAQVFVADGSSGGLSQPNGRYRVWVRPGRHVLVAQRIGYKPDSLDILVDSSSVRADFLLESQPLLTACGSPESPCPLRPFRD